MPYPGFVLRPKRDAFVFTNTKLREERLRKLLITPEEENIYEKYAILEGICDEYSASVMLSNRVVEQQEFQVSLTPR